MRRDGLYKRLLSAVFLSVCVGLIVVSPVSAASSKFSVGVLSPGMTLEPVLEGFREGLDRLGHKEGKQVAFIVVDTKGDSSDLGPRVATLLEAKPDVLFTVTTAYTAAAKRATSVVPIVFVFVTNPVESGLVAGYASSKNNVTGVATYSAAISGKRLEILREAAPRIKTVLTIVAIRESFALSAFRSLEEAAKKLGVQLVRRDVTTREEIEQALKDTPKGSVDAIFHVPSALVRSHIGLLIKKAREDKIPLDVNEHTLVQLGGLISYGAESRLLGAQAAKLVVKILKGTPPSDIPIETPERFFLSINLATAKAIGLKIPRGVLERADFLVE
jgi:putative ABC transport system substrate-binding protein